MIETHIHEKLDQYGYCECGIRVLTHFRGFPLPDRPSYKCSVCDSRDKDEHNDDMHAQEGVW